MRSNKNMFHIVNGLAIALCAVLIVIGCGHVLITGKSLYVSPLLHSVAFWILLLSWMLGAASFVMAVFALIRRDLRSVAVGFGTFVLVVATYIALIMVDYKAVGAWSA